MGRVCMVRDLVAELVMGRVCYGPSLSWAEFVMGRDVPESDSRLAGKKLTLRAVGLITAGYCRIPQETAGDRRVPQDT